MKKLNTIIMSGVLAATMAVTATPAFAQDAPAYYLVQQYQLHPTKSDDFSDAWKSIISSAKEHGYNYPTFVSKSGPRVSMATPLSSYADVDAMFADRNRVYEEGGSSFERAVDDLNAATHSETSMMAKHMPDISNPPSDEDMASITMFEISTIHIQPGNSDKFKEIMTEYKAGLTDAGLADGAKYNVYAGGVGGDGAYFFQSFAKSGADMAEQDAKSDAMFKDNKDMQDLFGEFQAISTAGAYSSSDKWKMSKELTYFPAE